MESDTTAKRVTTLPEGDHDYNAYIEQMRIEEYPMLRDAIYLDHAGTGLPNKTTLDQFHAAMLSNLYCNPHSTSANSQRTSQEIANVRLRLLQHVGADADAFDLVFVPNATAGIKLVAEAMREVEGGFDYAYHVDSHTSLIGVREFAVRSVCVATLQEVQSWRLSSARPALFAYPAQSNMNGKRLPLSWCKEARENNVYTMLDAAAYATTARLYLDETQPDFTVISLAKMFGFPDLGALIIRKEAAHLFDKRKYFGGGTVDMVACRKEQWHIRKHDSLHEQLEDGTLPIHSIQAIDFALSAQRTLFGSIDRIARHTRFLAQRLHHELKHLKHANGKNVVQLYDAADLDQSAEQGPTIAFNLMDSHDQWISNFEVDKLASIKNIQLRTGQMCNPGGVADALLLQPWDLRRNHDAGYRCGGESDILHGKPTGLVRVSLGAMSTLSDVDGFLDFVNEYFVDRCTTQPISTVTASSLQVEALIVYPVKSCAGWQVPHDTVWDIRQEGLAWDREWCIVHLGTGAALSQKAYPRMALIRPELNLHTGRLKLDLGLDIGCIDVPLSQNPDPLERDIVASRPATVCNDKIEACRYISSIIADKLTAFLGTPCTLARFPASSTSQQSARHRKNHLRGDASGPILLSNESPILTITRSSLNALNEVLKARGQRATHHSVFRANIILAEPPYLRPGSEQAWAEDQWQGMRISSGTRSTTLQSLGGCRRCQMVCIDQLTAAKRSEIFLTLAKHRRINGRVLFGIHTALNGQSYGRVQVGDSVDTF